MIPLGMVIRHRSEGGATMMDQELLIAAIHKAGWSSPSTLSQDTVMPRKLLAN